ncbi:hypothetical protein MKX01_040511 [Papaver californicum]|nr:hypothetical protein MKX01_040511 [Papaver californicum]
MSKSFSVLGSAAAIFFFYILLTLSLVDGKKTVLVKNDIGPDISLTIHCWSSEDDLGVHTLYHLQTFYWRFTVNFSYTTEFVCDSSWHGPGRVGFSNRKRFTAYKAKRDWNTHCNGFCMWSIRQDGGYFGDGGSRYPFQKMFSYP